MSDLTIFAREMNQLAKTVNGNVVKLHKKVSLEVVEFVANSTPVLTGQAAGNWKTRIGSPANNYDPGPSSSGNSVSDARANLSGLAEGQTVHITNNVPYIVKLNQGYSGQAPAAFVELSALIALQNLGRFNLLIK